MGSINIRLLLAPIALAMVGLPAQADIYTLNIDHCSGSCIPAGSSSIGTVTVTQDGADTVKIVVDGDFQFVNTTSAPDAFLFDISGTPTITVSNVTSGWELVSGTVGSLGGGGWSFEYAMKCQFTPDGACPGNGASNGANPPLVFDVSAPGLTTADFDVAGSGTTADFAADVLSNRKTGLVGAALTSTTNLNPVPEPGSIILFGTILGGIVTGVRKGRSQRGKELV